MKLRTKLIVLQSAVITILTVIIVGLVASLLGSAIPLMERGVTTKTQACLHALLADADVGIAARDEPTLAKLVERCGGGRARDEDLAFIAVLDASGRVLARSGRVPGDLRLDPALGKAALERLPGRVRGQAPVMLEGQRLGAVFAEYRTRRIDQWRRYYVAFTVVALALILLSAVASVFFALHLIRPLREMIGHVHRVAAGNLDEPLQTRASDELGQLAEDLNVMTTRLRESRQLMSDASRHAGMAEVARNVLHNVGNVLNSINVSCSIIVDTVSASKGDRVARVARLLAEHEHDLAEFLARDGKGDELRRYIDLVAEQLAGERAALSAEVESLRKNVEHVKAIISTQQQYSRSVGVTEATRLEEVVESGLAVISAAAERHGIVVVRDYEETPQLELDRHRLLQILVNLFSNARRALRDGSAGPRKVLRVSIKRRGDDRIRIAVADNGVGIAPENLARIFQHGFSTKPDGHGFGLHASANNAAELGGVLRCHSDGPGRGAVFALDLPLDPRKGRLRPAAGDPGEEAAVARPQGSESDAAEEANP